MLISRVSRQTSRREATPRLAGLRDSRKDLDEQLRANDPPQVEAGWSSGGLEIRTGLAAKLQNGESLVHEHTRRREARQQQAIRLARQRVCLDAKRQYAAIGLERQRRRNVSSLGHRSSAGVRHAAEHARSAVNLLEQLRRLRGTLGGTKNSMPCGRSA